MSELSLRDVHLVYPGATPVTALAGVSLTIEPGEFVAIDGPSGGGKSTLLNVPGLLDAPTAGTYLIDGDPVRADGGPAARMRSDTFAFIFQSFHLLARRPVLDSVELALLHRAVAPAERRRRAADALAAVGLADRAWQRADTLSGGQQQRVAIARALATGAPVVLADEPTGNLDTTSSAAVIAALRAVHARGVTVVLVTHDPAIAAAADRRITVLDGSVVDDTRRTPTTPTPRRLATPRPVPPGRASRVRPADAVRDVLASLASRLGRTTGLALAVAAAVGLSVATAGLTASASAQVSAAFDARQNRFVTVTEPASTDQQPVVRGWSAPSDQTRATGLNQLAGVQAASLVVDHGQHTVTAAPTRTPVTTTAYSGTADLLTSTGTKVTWADLDHPALGKGQVLLGAQLAAQLDLGPLVTSPAILIDGRSVTVAGLITSSERVPAWTSAIVAPSEDRELFGHAVQTQAVILTAAGAALQVAHQAPLVMDPVDPSSLTVVAPTDPRDLRATIENDVRTAMAVLTAVAVFAAILALTNAMVLAVNERRGELALRRALGARTVHVAGLITGEACATGALGGIAGLVGGILGILAVSIARHWAPVLDLRIAPWALVGGIALGAVAGLAAAVAAVRVQPGRALRD
ncbi:MAG: ABC transporter ATP-binding protein/permease [Cellulomonas sp.]|nr:ABC transporter ATP-binding protein/permease [Cellulomonas sp.]